MRLIEIIERVDIPRGTKDFITTGTLGFLGGVYGADSVDDLASKEIASGGFKAFMAIFLIGGAVTYWKQRNNPV